MSRLTRLPFLLKAALALVALLVLGLLARGAAESWSAPDSDSAVQVAMDNVLSGEIDGDLALFGGALLLSPDVRVDGDAALLGASITVDGRVNGDLTAMGSSIVLAEGSRIDGDAALNARVVTVAGTIAGDLMVTAESLVLAPGAQIDGRIYPCVPASGQSLGARAEVGSCNAADQAQLFAPVQNLQPALEQAAPLPVRLAGALAFGLLLAGLSVLLVAALPERLHAIRTAVRERPADSLSAFVAAALLGAGLAALLVLLLALVPPVGIAALPLMAGLGIAGGVLLLVGLVNAVVSLGLLAGARIAPAHPALVTVLLGSLLVALPALAMAVAPALAPLAAALLVLLAAPGAGAALISRMGSRPLRRARFVQA